MNLLTKRVFALLGSLVIAVAPLNLPTLRKSEPKAQYVNLLDSAERNLPKPPTFIVKPNPNVKTVEKSQSEETVLTFRVTAYTANDAGQDGRGITASGKKASPYYTMAASKNYPFGTRLVDVETGKIYEVQDRGGAIKGQRLDLYVGNSKAKALNFGVQYRKFRVILPK